MGHISDDLPTFSDFSYSEDKRKTSSLVDGMYAIVYHGLTPLLDLSPTETLLVAIIASLSRKSGECFASQGTLAVMVGVTPVSVGTNLKTMEEKGLIVRGQGKRTKGTIPYRLGGKVQEELQYLQRQINYTAQQKKSKGYGG